MSAPSPRYASIRLQMFEAYEQGATFPLVISSDRTLLTDLAPTDRVVMRWWVREGGNELLPGEGK